MKNIIKISTKFSDRPKEPTSKKTTLPKKSDPLIPNDLQKRPSVVTRTKVKIPVTETGIADGKMNITFVPISRVLTLMMMTLNALPYQGVTSRLRLLKRLQYR